MQLCNMLGLDTNIANKHMQISEPPSSQTVLGWIHFSSTVFASSQPSRAEMFEQVGACILQFLSSFTISISSFTQLSQEESISDNPFPLSHSFHRWKVFRGIKCSLNIIAFHVSLSAGCPQSSANHPSVH